MLLILGLLNRDEIFGRHRGLEYFVRCGSRILRGGEAKKQHGVRLFDGWGFSFVAYEFKMSGRLSESLYQLGTSNTVSWVSR